MIAATTARNTVEHQRRPSPSTPTAATPSRKQRCSDGERRAIGHATARYRQRRGAVPRPSDSRADEPADDRPTTTAPTDGVSHGPGRRGRATGARATPTSSGQSRPTQVDDAVRHHGAVRRRRAPGDDPAASRRSRRAARRKQAISAMATRDPPQLVARVAADHEQREVDPDDLPAPGDEHEADERGTARSRRRAPATTVTTPSTDGAEQVAADPVARPGRRPGAPAPAAASPSSR